MTEGQFFQPVRRGSVFSDQNQPLFGSLYRRPNDRTELESLFSVDSGQNEQRLELLFLEWESNFHDFLFRLFSNCRDRNGLLSLKKFQRLVWTYIQKNKEHKIFFSILILFQMKDVPFKKRRWRTKFLLYLILGKYPFLNVREYNILNILKKHGWIRGATICCPTWLVLR